VVDSKFMHIVCFRFCKVFI